MKEKNIFFRQSFTEAGEEEQKIIQRVLDKINNVKDDAFKINILTGNKAYNKSTFKASFENEYGIKFTPGNFRKKRFELLDASDVFIILRTGMSESTAFEIAYNVYGGNNIPMLYLIWDKAPIKTTLIREMEDIADITYHTFSDATDFGNTIEEFIVNKMNAVSLIND